MILQLQLAVNPPEQQGSHLTDPIIARRDGPCLLRWGLWMMLGAVVAIEGSLGGAIHQRRLNILCIGVIVFRHMTRNEVLYWLLSGTRSIFDLFQVRCGAELWRRIELGSWEQGWTIS